MDDLEKVQHRVRVVEKSGFDDEVLSRTSFASREAAEHFVTEQKDEGIVYEIEDGGH